MGAILTTSSHQMREEVLAGLEHTDPDFAALIWEAILTCKDIPKRIAPKDLAKALRPINLIDLFVALVFRKTAGFEKAVAFLLDNMTGRRCL